jgi:hypothetical protein
VQQLLCAAQRVQFRPHGRVAEQPLLDLRAVLDPQLARQVQQQDAFSA